MASVTSTEKKKLKTPKTPKTPITKKTASKPILEADANPIKLEETDDYVTRQWRAQSAVCEFLIRNAYLAMLSARASIIFDPFPASWYSSKSNLKQDATAIKQDATAREDINVSTVIKEREIITSIDIVLASLKNSYNDAELLERLNPQTYELIRFILEANKVFIKADNLLSSSDLVIYNPYTDTNKSGHAKEHATQNTVIDLNSLGLIQFKVEHTQLVEDRFKAQDTVYLYHGSRAENWYSIMCNGLKIGSKSKYFLNGAAYGNGIYLSDDIKLSLGYSTGVGVVYNPQVNTSGGSDILAIFEVIKSPRWHKSSNIYVVNDEEALALRYLLVFNDFKNPIMQGVFNAINKKLNTGGIKAAEKQKKEMEAKNITVIHNKRLMREYQNIMKQSPQALGFNIQLAEEDNLGRWMIYLTRPENPKLEEQMQRLGIQAIEIEITFKENYPIAPPFIRVVYPHFKFHSGHITIGGSLCMEMLTNQGWSPTFNVENVITQIKMAISDGGGEIDESNYRKRYTMDEALDAFKRVLATHGWV